MAKMSKTASLDKYSDDEEADKEDTFNNEELREKRSEKV